jgi:hypothetical protein
MDRLVAAIRLNSFINFGFSFRAGFAPFRRIRDGGIAAMLADLPVGPAQAPLSEELHLAVRLNGDDREKDCPDVEFHMRSRAIRTGRPKTRADRPLSFAASRAPGQELHMTTDHQITEQEPPGTERTPGMIVTALIVIATLCTVVLLVAH